MSRVTATTMSDPERIVHDACAASDLCDALDAERGVPADQTFASLVPAAQRPVEDESGDVSGGKAAVPEDSLVARVAQFLQTTHADDAAADAKSTSAAQQPRAVLELAIGYLRRVHFYCYYSAAGAHNADELVKRCGAVHYRGRHVPADAEVEEGEARADAAPVAEPGQVDSGDKMDADADADADADKDKAKSDGGDADAGDGDGDGDSAKKAAAEVSDDKPKPAAATAAPPAAAPVRRGWTATERSLDERIAYRIKLAREVVSPPQAPESDAPPDEFFRSYLIKHENGRVRCAECSKLFVGEEFVRKHVLAKHDRRTEEEREAAREVQRKKWLDEHTFETYRDDPNRIITPPAPVVGVVHGHLGVSGAGVAVANRAVAPANYVDLDAPPADNVASIDYRAVVNYDDLGF
jgi:hypothetical protein